MAAVFRPGQPVRELAPPHRAGVVRAVRGTGENARVTVNLAGLPPATFRPGQIQHA